LVIDAEKVEAARLGDKESFAQVYEIIAPDLYKVALYTLGNSHDAEDAVSETFVDAYRGITKLRNALSFKPWMMKILSIRCKRKIAEYVRGKNVFDIENFAAILSDDVDMAGEVSEQLTVMTALGRLNPQERMIVSLSVLQGYTTKEIASIMGSPQGTISSKLHRALAKLRRMLEQP
jgi:RNA polymerase sigma-70 factor (ECF subfamily)